MASNTANSSPTERSKQYIDRQLRRTRRQVKLVDLAASTAGLVAGLLGELLVLIVIDHWIYGLGFWSRMLACVVLVAVTGWHLCWNILPLVVRPIVRCMPRTIERVR